MIIGKEETKPTYVVISKAIDSTKSSILTVPSDAVFFITSIEFQENTGSSSSLELTDEGVCMTATTQGIVNNSGSLFTKILLSMKVGANEHINMQNLVGKRVLTELFAVTGTSGVLVISGYFDRGTT
ncbi:hypothetical protein [Caldisericum sp.]|uniref:hypothetical protein n=1 Tax=Caldisericum sp. TaxID=2499687 RepID=UPI003D110CEC